MCAIIRPLTQADLPAALRIVRTAFGTFLGAPEPENFWADLDYVYGRFAAEHVESQIAACREGLGGVRASLDGVVTPEVVDQATAAWQEQTATLRRRRREVALIEEALRGKVFVRKL